MTTRESETETCGPSRELVRSFVAMSASQRSALSQDEREKIAVAFHHIDMCVQGHGMPELCNHLWRDLQTSEDPEVQQYLHFGEFPLHQEEFLLDDNPLANLDW